MRTVESSLRICRILADSLSSTSCARACWRILKRDPRVPRGQVVARSNHETENIDRANESSATLAATMHRCTDATTRRRSLNSFCSRYKTRLRDWSRDSICTQSVGGIGLFRIADRGSYGLLVYAVQLIAPRVCCNLNQASASFAGPYLSLDRSRSRYNKRVRATALSTVEI